MKTIVTAIALAIALPAAAQAAPAADHGMAMKMDCMSKMQGHDMSNMDMKGMDMAGMTMKGHDMPKMPSCADAARKGAPAVQDAHSTHAK